MPCGRNEDYGPDPEEQKRHAIAVRLACEYLTLLENSGWGIPGYAVDYWEQHKRADQRRLAAEAEAARIEELRHSALAKLSESEIAALKARPPFCVNWEE